MSRYADIGREPDDGRRDLPDQDLLDEMCGRCVDGSGSKCLPSDQLQCWQELNGDYEEEDDVSEQPCANCGTRHEADAPCACPLCGDEAMMVLVQRRYMWRAECVNPTCLACGPLSVDRTIAKEKWNHRTVIRDGVECCTACGRPVTTLCLRCQGHLDCLTEDALSERCAGGDVELFVTKCVAFRREPKGKTG